MLVVCVSVCRISLEVACDFTKFREWFSLRGEIKLRVYMKATPVHVLNLNCISKTEIMNKASVFSLYGFLSCWAFTLFHLPSLLLFHYSFFLFPHWHFCCSLPPSLFFFKFSLLVFLYFFLLCFCQCYLPSESRSSAQ